LAVGAEAQAAGEPEDASGEQGDVHSGDDEEVEGAGAFEAETEGAGQAGAIAEEHGVEHAGVVGGEAEEGGQATVGGGAAVSEQAGGGRGLRGEDAALQGCGDWWRGGG
jgi:hypothetical protein